MNPGAINRVWEIGEVSFLFLYQSVYRFDVLSLANNPDGSG